MTRKIPIGPSNIGGGAALMIIAGPCVIEDEDITFHTAKTLKDITQSLGLGFVFKCSFDKANRSSITSYRGPGLKDGLRVLSDIKRKLNIPVITDVHDIKEVAPVAENIDAIQIPAFLCRQTDLIVECARTNKPVNIKKGQFMAPWDMKNVIEKFLTAGNSDLMLTERGACFGYNNLIVDMRSFPIMRSFGQPVIFDVTHSLQLPGGLGRSTGGQREFAAPMMRAAAAVGVDGLFMEVHPDPDRALCDGPNMIKLEDVEGLLSIVKKIDAIARAERSNG